MREHLTAERMYARGDGRADAPEADDADTQAAHHAQRTSGLASHGPDESGTIPRSSASINASV